MVSRAGPEEFDITFRFGEGLHTRSSEDEIGDREAAGGTNFLLDLRKKSLRNRKPFDLIAQVPNGAAVRGGGSLLKSDGSVSTLVQAGDTVYEWDGATSFTSKGTVSSNAKLRGHWRSHNWVLGDKLILTDLAVAEVVKEWDGTTFQSTTFTDEDDNAFGDFKAKYLDISNERAVFSNVIDPGSTTPHMMVGTARGDYTQITVSNRPSSALSEGDPFFLLVPDLKPINGHVAAFGSVIVSSEYGRMFNLTGSTAKDFAFDEFYPGSNASGAESLTYIGNDIIFGRMGRIESVRDTDRFGDSETDDLTVPVSDTIEGYTNWTNVYNSRLNRVYCFPSGIGECWVLQTALRGGALTAVTPERNTSSPWTQWTTEHLLDFQPTFVMPMLDPVDGLEYTFMGDSSGNFYRLEGTGDSGDGGANDITTEWLSKLFFAPLDAEMYEVEGFIEYRKNEAATVTLTFEYAGENAANEAITIDIPALTGANYWGGSAYWGGDFYWGVAFKDRLSRQQIFGPGQSNGLQVRVSSTGTTNIDINKVLLRFRAAS